MKFNYWNVCLFIIVITCATRFYKVTEPDHVCWDETHFGKMASWYINRTFFFDVHPPLGKMLIALSGYLTGYNGTYPFEKPGDKYNGTQYEGMRIFCTGLGAMIVPIAYDTVHDLTGSIRAALLSASYLLFDVGLLTLNQYILLDPFLLCFMVCSVWGMVKVSKHSRNNGSFTKSWWLWLFVTGTMLSCTISVKFVGLFVVLLVGLGTITDLWLELGNLKTPVIAVVKQFLARAVTLIVWPLVLYMIFFYIHLTILNRSGSGDGFYSSAFQSCLQGNSLHNASMPRKVAYGAEITLKNYKTGGGYLHSHYHLYPKGSGARQQQITTYTHKDDNNKWTIKPYNSDKLLETKIVKNGDIIRLEHVATRRNLHSHNQMAPLTKKHFQVTGYGENGTGDANDYWKIVIVNGNSNDEILTVTSRLMLVHYLQNCALTTSGKQLPKWGFEQQEVTCNPNLRDKNGYWNVEDNVFGKLPNVSFRVYEPSFLAKFIESHAVMFQGNAGLKPKEGEVTSKPWQWPINYRGQFFSGNTFRIYLLGNPIIWWSNLVFLVIFIVTLLYSLIVEQRQKVNDEVKLKDILNRNAIKSKHLTAATWLFCGWMLHYLPFWGMGRVLYFHHYFPALIFNSMLTGVIFNFFMEYLPSNFRKFVFILTMIILIVSFKLFSPLSYGMEGNLANSPNSTMFKLKWLDTWEF